MKNKWVSTEDLMKMIPGLSYLKALKHMKEIRQKMLDDGLRLPETKEFLVLKEYVKKEFGI
jgi:hypothetical protein